MSYKDLLSKIRHWDNIIARWITRHFYFSFFQLVLMIIFFVWLFNAIDVTKLNFETSAPDAKLRLEITQSINLSIIVILILINSFWTLYIFNSIKSITYLLRDVTYSINRLRHKN